MATDGGSREIIRMTRLVLATWFASVQFNGKQDGPPLQGTPSLRCPRNGESSVL